MNVLFTNQNLNHTYSSVEFYPDPSMRIMKNEMLVMSLASPPFAYKTRLPHTIVKFKFQ